MKHQLKPIRKQLNNILIKVEKMSKEVSDEEDEDELIDFLEEYAFDFMRIQKDYEDNKELLERNERLEDENKQLKDELNRLQG